MNLQFALAIANELFSLSLWSVNRLRLHELPKVRRECLPALARSTRCCAAMA